MQKLSQAFNSARHLSVQEAVDLCLPELCLRKCFRRVTFINTSLPNDRIATLRPETELDEFYDDTTNIFKSGIMENFCQRVNGSNSTVKNICIAAFTSWYTT